MQVQWKIHGTNETTSLPQLVSCVCQDLSPCKSRWTDLRRFKTDATWFNQISSKEKTSTKKEIMIWHVMTSSLTTQKSTWVERSWVWVSIASHNRRYSLLRSSISWKWKQLEGMDGMDMHGWHVIFIRQARQSQWLINLPLTLALSGSFRIKLSNMPSVFWTESILVIGGAADSYAIPIKIW